jgi:anthranilate phosphoribosyltransferase
VVGVSDHARLPLLAGALAALGSLHALVVYGEPGLDEISPLGCTHVQEVREGAVQSWTIDPERLGLGGATAAELAGGTPADNASAIVDVLGGRRHGGARSAVLLNAAAAIYVAFSGTSYENALALAQRALDDGRGLDALERLRSATQAHEQAQ